jgi:hypothetical protein
VKRLESRALTLLTPARDRGDIETRRTFDDSRHAGTDVPHLLFSRCRAFYTADCATNKT